MTLQGPVPAHTTAFGQITETGNTTVVSAEDTEAYVRQYFADIPIMIEVARCESTFRHTLADGSVLKGRVDNDDTGVMQINKRFHADRAAQLGYDLYSIDGNLDYARDLYERKGTQPWNASAPCWRQTLAYNG